MIRLKWLEIGVNIWAAIFSHSLRDVEWTIKPTPVVYLSVCHMVSHWSMRPSARLLLFFQVLLFRLRFNSFELFHSRDSTLFSLSLSCWTRFTFWALITGVLFQPPEGNSVFSPPSLIFCSFLFSVIGCIETQKHSVRQNKNNSGLLRSGSFFSCCVWNCCSISDASQCCYCLHSYNSRSWRLGELYLAFLWMWYLRNAVRRFP